MSDLVTFTGEILMENLIFRAVLNILDRAFCQKASS